MNRVKLNQFDETLYRKTLDNGLEVFLLPRNEMEKTYGIFSTKYGSIDQSFSPIGEDEIVTVPDGIAHFLEHKLFEKEDGDVFQIFSKQGASANAYTSFTRTSYLFSSTKYVNENVNTLLNFVQNPYFSDETVEKEKGIIAQEIKMYDDQPDWRLFFGVIRSMFAEHPVRIDIAGTVESITNITKENLYTCYNTFYHPSNMVLFVTGPIQPEEMMALIEGNQAKKSFDPPEDIKRSYPDEPESVAEKEVIINMPVSTSKCLVGVKQKAAKLEKNEILYTKLVTDMVFDYFFSKSGEYYEQLDQKGLIEDQFDYEIYVESTFGFCAIGGDSRKPKELYEELKQMLLTISQSSIREEDFERMKKKKLGDLIRSLNSLESVANQFIQYHQIDINYFDVFDLLDKMTVEDFQKFLSDWITEDRISVCYVLPE
ncbi:EF-P 5-aminopentanol modification-associated protein YfmH [Salirhabdus salicampi]|uniref:EF-P 5-aminopentanol modification-associated protein YfmH n=1 Tax=Salirhabdus salicampi TaxID=476102 RepID=UPI0020C50AB7|nr:pitrilysin family protein [Salirhabdus salicampi]MCP8616459.1 insulinase family protein [Salirhabdus salicampi]